jgi:hypothetical protein
MKKLLFLLIVLVCVPVLKANPISPPPATIDLSEIAFENNGNWVMELQYYNYHGSNIGQPIDSIFISSSTGRAKLKRFKIGENSGVIMVRKDSLLSNLTINPISDSIRVTYFIHLYSSEATILSSPAVYGNLVTATIRTPKAGQSISVYGAPGMYNTYNYSRNAADVCSIDKSPSIGMENDTTGMMGTLQGKIYDPNNQLLTSTNNTYYGIGFFDFQPRADGSYSTRVFSKKHRFSQIYYNSGSNKFIVDIAPMTITIYPDTIVTEDIHILNVSDISQVKSDPQQVMQVFPNPMTESSFTYTISIPVKSADSFIELTNMAGQQIVRYKVTEDKGKLDLPSKIANGTYTLRLMVNNKNYGTTKVLIAH